jgi:hypothetical protein
MMKIQTHLQLQACEGRCHCPEAYVTCAAADKAPWAVWAKPQAVNLLAECLAAQQRGTCIKQQQQ